MPVKVQRRFWKHLHKEILHWQIYLLENVTQEFCYTGTPVPEFVLHRKNKPGKSDAG